MRLSGTEVVTTGELMAEIFEMEESLINNMTEKVRYGLIYDYLTKNGAIALGEKKLNHQTYLIFEFEADSYLIPVEIFDETDQSWRERLKPNDEEVVSNNKTNIISFFKRAT